tara:strand:- start:1449 stop:2087 length:639 start_codon:yes stop_codon:yes gene_type:complete
MQMSKKNIFLLSILLFSNASASLIKEDKTLDISNDELIAQSLSNIVLYEGEPWMPLKIRESYIAYDLAVKTKVKYDMNVHQFNAATGLKMRLPLLMTNDDFSTSTMSFGVTRAALETSEDYMDFNKKNALKTNLDQLQGHLNTSKIEASETGVNVEELFSRVWSLAAINPDFSQQLFLSLCDNSETGGGCYAGHAGRLARLYVNFLRPQWLE